MIDARFRIRSLGGTAVSKSPGRSGMKNADAEAIASRWLVTSFCPTVKTLKSFGQLRSAFCAKPCVIAAMILLAATSALASERRQSWTWCMNAQHRFALDLVIRGCTAVIQSGQETLQDQAIAFAYRGNAYREKGDLDRSLSDFSEAILINPGFARR
jgi:hypothetical protein